MRKNSVAFVVVAFLPLVGCNRPSRTVYVDIDAVLAADKPATPTQFTPPSPPLTRPALSEKIVGSSAVAIVDPANAPRQSVQAMFEAGQRNALASLLVRLQELNKGALLEFRAKQRISISEKQTQAYSEANARIRPVFDAWATERAPIFADLAFLAGFPIPKAINGETTLQTVLRPKLRGKTADQLRVELTAIDDRFRLKCDEILAAVGLKSKADQIELAERIKQLTNDLEANARREANAQIRRAVSKLNFDLSDSSPIRLPRSPDYQLSIPAEKPLQAAPRVPSGGILDEAADRRRLLEHELRIWLALNGYSLSANPSRQRDATKEFQIWRQQHAAGP